MRVKVLVAAAVVITSVNAGLIKGPKDLSNGDVNQESVQSEGEWGPFQDSEPTKQEPVNEPKLDFSSLNLDNSNDIDGDDPNPAHDLHDDDNDDDDEDDGR
ncbi:hypothetical protein BASA83_013292 [Batrachochytrium salamandrivorans]|nr:hypothetical protein BASA83_013292 [Batrachochytrium salamandrivorans]